MGIRLSTAYKMAIESLEKERRERYAFSYNSAEQFGFENIAVGMRRGVKMYDKYTEAIEMLEREKNLLTTKERR